MIKTQTIKSKFAILNRSPPPFATAVHHRSTLHIRDMDCKEQIEKLKNYEARFAGYLKAKYFSDKDIYGGELFEEKATIGGMTIRASSEAGTKSYAEPLAYWNEKFAQKEPKTETKTNLSNGKHSSEKSS